MRIDCGISQPAEDLIRRLSSLVAESIPSASSVTVAVAAVEAFVDDALMSRMEGYLRDSPNFGRYLLNRSSSALRQSWPARLETLNRGFLISIEPETIVQDLLLVVDVRNALAHGDGRLTEYQTKSWARAVELERNLAQRLQVRFRVKEIIVDDDSLARILNVLIDFVLALDRELLQQAKAGS